jgi:NUMOD3 motif
LGTKGYKHTPETIAKLKLKRKGRKPNLGKKHSPETIAKMAAIKTGKKYSEQTKSKQSLSKLGKPRQDHSFYDRSLITSSF